MSLDEHSLAGGLPLGTVLKGKYRLDRVLGSGGMAVVYEATHRNQKRFAVKVLHPGLAARPDLRERFLREGYLANTVGHTGAVAVLDDDTTDQGAPFLVMELLEGKPLERLQAELGGVMSEAAVLSMAHQLLGVLVAAHGKAIVHRDIKPANIFATSDGSLKVLDFGIARMREILGTSESATATGMLLGTPTYMSPEQAAGRTSLVDGQTDIWAVGATMFMLLTGESVHSGETPQHVAMLAATTPARSIASVVPNVHPRVAAIVDGALVYDKAARWRDAATMQRAVEETFQACFGEPVGKRPLAEALAQGASLPHAPTARPPSDASARRASRPSAAPVAAQGVSGRNYVGAGSVSRPVSGALPPTEYATSSQAVPLKSAKGIVAASIGIGITIALAGGMLLRSRFAAPPTDGTESNATLMVDNEAGAAVGPSQAPTAVPFAVDASGPIPPLVLPAPTAPSTATAPEPPSSEAPPLPPSATATTPATAKPPREHKSRTNTAAPPSCNPPYYSDSKGIRRVKPECL